MSKLTEWRDAQARTRAARDQLTHEVALLHAHPTAFQAAQVATAAGAFALAASAERDAAHAVDVALGEVS